MAVIQWLSLLVKYSVFVFSRMVSLVSLSKLWSGDFEKCLYSGKFVLILLAALCPASLWDSDLLVCPTYWFFVVHLEHSSRYITFLVLQFACLGVANDL